MSDDKQNNDSFYLPRTWSRRGKNSGPSKRDAAGSEEFVENGLSPAPFMLDDEEDDLEREPAETGTVGIDVALRRDRENRDAGEGSRHNDDESLYIETKSVIDPTCGASRTTVTVCGVRFGRANRIYQFDTGGLELTRGDWVIVRTEKGTGLGYVAVPPSDKEMELIQLEGLRRVLRKAGRTDFDQFDRCKQREKEAFTYCLEKITSLGLPMKLVAVECFFDSSKYVFHFTAEGRVDFRELVKHLVARFPVRIEMRQIGVRHEAKMIGGLGTCGQELCCSRFLTDFKPVSVRMAKTQNLSLNPTKISGVCGRLMCCLGYEHEIYEEFKKGLPKIGKSVKTPKGEGVVIKHNPLTETVLLQVDEETTLEVRREDVVHGCAGCCGGGICDSEDLDERDAEDFFEGDS